MWEAVRVVLKDPVIRGVGGILTGVMAYLAHIERTHRDSLARMDNKIDTKVGALETKVGDLEKKMDQGFLALRAELVADRNLAGTDRAAAASDRAEAARDRRDVMAKLEVLASRLPGSGANV